MTFQLEEASPTRQVVDDMDDNDSSVYEVHHRTSALI